MSWNNWIACPGCGTAFNWDGSAESIIGKVCGCGWVFGSNIHMPPDDTLIEQGVYADVQYPEHEPRNDFPLMRHTPPCPCALCAGDRIADDAKHIHELLQATGLTAAEYMLLRNAALSLMPPRTYNLKGDDLV